MDQISPPYRFKGEIVNEEQVKKILESAPAIVKTYMKKYMRYAGNAFIGSKRKDGAVRKALAERRKPDGQGWARKFINAAANYRIDDVLMTMRAGVVYTNKKKIHEIMELLETGFDSTSQGYKIFANREEAKFANNREMISCFHRMLNSKKLTFVFKNNNILYFDKDTKKLMFVGSKRTHFDKKWDFEKEINSVYGKVEKKAAKVLDLAVEDAQNHAKFTDHEIGD